MDRYRVAHKHRHDHCARPLRHAVRGEELHLLGISACHAPRRLCFFSQRLRPRPTRLLKPRRSPVEGHLYAGSVHPSWPRMDKSPLFVPADCCQATHRAHLDNVLFDRRWHRYTWRLLHPLRASSTHHGIVSAPASPSWRPRIALLRALTRARRRICCTQDGALLSVV